MNFVSHNGNFMLKGIKCQIEYFVIIIFHIQPACYIISFRVCCIYAEFFFEFIRFSQYKTRLTDIQALDGKDLHSFDQTCKTMQEVTGIN